MRFSDRDHLGHLLEQVQTGTLDRSATVALLIMVRGTAAKGSALRDIGDGIAHDERDRGLAFEELKAFARQMVRAAISGSRLDIRVLYPIEEVVRDLGRVAELSDVAFDVARAMHQKVSLSRALASAVDGTTLLVNKMVEVKLEALPDPSWYVMPLWDVRGDVAHLRRNVAIGGPLFLPDRLDRGAE